MTLRMMDSRNVKVWFCVACLASTMALPAPQSSPQLYLDIIDMAAISRMSPQQLETLAEGLAAEEIMRTKRSSAHALTSVVSKASSGLQSKVGLLGQASAFISAASSKSSPDEHTGYSYEPHSEKYDYWGLKKSILYTLFQAVKAITGGVTILKGQLIKGGGALASTLGKVIAVKGDAVSNLGKKIVSSAALSHKKPHAAVYGPPAHVEYGPPPSAYGAPTAPAHYVAPSLPTGYAAHKYPSTLDGRGKLNGVHAGLVFLAPLAENHDETLETAHSGHTPLEPPPSILHTVYSAIKNVFNGPAPVHEHIENAPVHSAPVVHTAPASTAYSHTAPAHSSYPTAPATYSGYTAQAAPTGPSGPAEPYSFQHPPPPQSVPHFKPMSWAAVDSYGQPAATESFPDYDPRSPHYSFDHASAKSSVPTLYPKKTGLTADKLQKINFNLNKLRSYMNQQQRSSEVLPQFNGLEMLKHGILNPTPVVTDNEIGVLPAEFLPDLDTTTTTTTTTTTSTTTMTTETPKTTPAERRKKEVKFFLRGNKIVQV